MTLNTPNHIWFRSTYRNRRKIETGSFHMFESQQKKHFNFFIQMKSVTVLILSPCPLLCSEAYCGTPTAMLVVCSDLPPTESRQSLQRNILCTVWPCLVGLDCEKELTLYLSFVVAQIKKDETASSTQIITSFRFFSVHRISRARVRAHDGTLLQNDSDEYWISVISELPPDFCILFWYGSGTLFTDRRAHPTFRLVHVRMLFLVRLKNPF